MDECAIAVIAETMELAKRKLECMMYSKDQWSGEGVGEILRREWGRPVNRR
jgi:hypothetical protein